MKRRKKTCPNCKKSDEVVPIVYGYPSSGLFIKADEGKVKLGGCMITECDPQWYCRRDDKEF